MGSLSLLLICPIFNFEIFHFEDKISISHPEVIQRGTVHRYLHTAKKCFRDIIFQARILTLIICLLVRPMVKANLKIVAFKARFWQKALRFLKSGGIEPDGATGKHQRLLRRYKYFRMSLHTRVFISSSFGDMQVYKGLWPTRNPRNDVVENNHSSK